jgi:hypothetical protein
MKFFQVFFTTALLISLGNAVEIQVDCKFILYQGEYTCKLSEIEVPDDRNASFIIGGDHLSGAEDDDVKKILVTHSSIPFIITPLFAKFQSASLYINDNGGLKRIQSNAFLGARNLKVVVINKNENLRVIEPEAFVGLSQLLRLDLSSNSIESLDETSFSGLNEIQVIDAEKNQISELPANIFASLKTLKQVVLSNNILTALYGRLFANNPNMGIVDFMRNKINAIDRTFLDGLYQLQYANMKQNECVDDEWFVRESVTIETVRGDLEQCFRNAEYVEPTTTTTTTTTTPQPEPEPENHFRRFILEVFGPLNLKFENGTQVVKV